MAGLGLLPSVYIAQATSTSPHADDHGIKLGVASYSLRKLSRADAIATVQRLGTPYINIKSFHLEYETSAYERLAAQSQFEAAGLQIVGGGTITLHQEDEAHIRKHFVYAKESGMPLMVVAPTPATLPMLEPFAKEFDIKVAVHNHGPEDRYFPGPADVMPILEGMDPRMGLCVDVGHTARTGVDVVQAIAEAGDRVLDLHMKDLADMTDRDSQVIVGEGKMPVAAIFRQLMAMDYDGYVNLEYEIDADNPEPGMQRSFAYMRGVLAGLEG
ncbi:MAG: hypothetical protein RhofKO_07280 [Rhodothermales bacterium]